MTTSKKQCFLIATHHVNKALLNLLNKIKKATVSYADVYLLVHGLPVEILGKNKELVPTHFFSDAILSDLGFVPIANRIIPGSNHFSVMDFFAKHDGYSYYWYIEYDVSFTGDWRTFLDFYKGATKDFFSCDIRFHENTSAWPWWQTLKHPEKDIALGNRLRSFNPIYRLSSAALLFIQQQLHDKWCGHHEVLLPTLLYHNNFLLGDFGGDGLFVDKGAENKFYSKETFRWRPAFEKVGGLRNKLYHPVK